MFVPGYYRLAALSAHFNTFVALRVITITICLITAYVSASQYANYGVTFGSGFLAFMLFISGFRDLNKITTPNNQLAKSAKNPVPEVALTFGIVLELGGILAVTGAILYTLDGNTTEGLKRIVFGVIMLFFSVPFLLLFYRTSAD